MYDHHTELVIPFNVSLSSLSLSSAVHNIYSQSDPSVGLVDRLLNCREVKEAPNIVTLHVTSFPYALQTQHTLISPYNEIHWPVSYSNVSDAGLPSNLSA